MIMVPESSYVSLGHGYRPDFVLTKDIAYFTLAGKVWSVVSDYIGVKWSML